MKSKEFFYSRAKKKFWQVNKLYFVLYFVVTRILSHSFVTSPQKITFNKGWGSTSQITKGRIQLKLKKPPKNKRPKAKKYILPWPLNPHNTSGPPYILAILNCPICSWHFSSMNIFKQPFLMDPIALSSFIFYIQEITYFIVYFPKKLEIICLFVIILPLKEHNGI